MKILTDNLFDSSTETLVVKIPKHPTAAKIEVRSVKGHSLAAVAVNNASKVVLSFNDTRLNCTNVGGNLWMVTKHAIPIDWLSFSTPVLTTDGVAKEWVFIPRQQELKGNEEYFTDLSTSDSINTLLLSGGNLRTIFINEKCECGCGRCSLLKAKDQTICDGCLCKKCGLKHIYRNTECVDCDKNID